MYVPFLSIKLLILLCEKRYWEENADIIKDLDFVGESGYCNESKGGGRETRTNYV